jgi:hypothetical protein
MAPRSRASGLPARVTACNKLAGPSGVGCQLLPETNAYDPALTCRNGCGGSHGSDNDDRFPTVDSRIHCKGTRIVSGCMQVSKPKYLLKYKVSSAVSVPWVITNPSTSEPSLQRISLASLAILSMMVAFTSEDIQWR